MIYLKTMLYEFEACMKYAILIKEKKKLSFLENGRGGLYMYLLHARYKFSVRTRYNPRYDIG